MTGRRPDGRDTQKGTDDVIEHDERMVPEYHKGHEIYGEHLARYEAARAHVKDKVVLDIATGAGYGAYLLAEAASKVIGVDISGNALEYAKRHFAAKNIEYRLGDGDNIPLEDASVDTVVSFETIEHIRDYKKFLKEVKRVLKKEGTLVLSTPNDSEFVKGNHFHLHQFTEEELQKLLSKHFKYTKMYYQTTWLFNLIGNEESFSKEWIRSMPVAQTTHTTVRQVLYFYVVCSERPIRTNVNWRGTVGEHWSERRLREKEHLTNNHIQNLEATIADNEAYALKLEQEIKRVEQALAHITQKWWYRVGRRAKRLLR